MTRRWNKTKYRATQQCEALVDDENDVTCHRRCKRKALRHDRLCFQHRSSFLSTWVICLQFKPKCFKSGPYGKIYRTTVIAKVFKSYAEAEHYYLMNWSLLINFHPHRKFVSLAIQTVNNTQRASRQWTRKVGEV